MNRAILRTYTVPAIQVTGLLLVILIGWSIWRSYEIRQLNSRADAAKGGSSGVDFVLEAGPNQHRRPVRASINVWPSEVTLGDSLSVALRLDDIDVPACTTAGLSMCPLGEEKDGSLIPTLTAAADCEITPHTARAIATKQDVKAFIWPWAVDCKTAGVKVLHLNLDLQPDGKTNDSAPLNFQQLSYFRVSDPLWPRILAFVTGLSGIITIVSGVLAKLMPHKTEKPSA